MNYKKNVKSILLFFVLLIALVCCDKSPKKIITAAERYDVYLPLLEGKKVAFIGNQTSIVNDTTHLVDFLISKGINVVKVFAPEHGFRNLADAGEKIDHQTDEKTGLPIVSLYGSDISTPGNDVLSDVDVLVFDIQDVGCRYYTYINTMQRIMEAGAKNNIPVIVLDRPNPNGFFIDGPILEDTCRSGIGYQPVPIVYGMTIGEYALMINEEKMLKDSVKCNLTVVPLMNYDHTSRYSIPILPSPNLPNDKAVNLFTSVCFFEGTPLSEGRGTDFPFQVFGSPMIDSTKTAFSFTPESCFGDKNPKQKDKKCFGKDLRNEPELTSINLDYIIWAYNNYTDKENFFLSPRAFAIRVGNYDMAEQIKQGWTSEQIKATWKDGIDKFKQIRKKYLLYKDFE